MKGSGEVVRLSAHDISDPSPSPLHDDGTHDAVLVAVGENVLVRDGLRPEYSQDSSEVLGVKGGQSRSLSVILQHSELYISVESTQLWYSLSMILVLYETKFGSLPSKDP